MPGIERLTISHLESEASEIAALGIPAVLLFGIPADKDEAASGAYDDEGIVQLAVRALKQAQPELIVITDVCLCEYMSHGHCGVVRDDGVVDNDVTLELLAKTAISHAEAGADAVAPSDMMDGRVAAIRAQLDAEGHSDAADRRLQREVRVRVLRAVPRRGRFGACVRRPARVPDGPGQRARGGARGAHRRRGGRRRRDGEAGASLPRRRATGARGGGRAGRRLQRFGRVRGAEGGGRARLARRARRRAGVADGDPARRRRRDRHLPREGGGASGFRSESCRSRSCARARRERRFRWTRPTSAC